MNNKPSKRIKKQSYSQFKKKKTRNKFNQKHKRPIIRKLQGIDKDIENRKEKYPILMHQEKYF